MSELDRTYKLKNVLLAETARYALPLLAVIVGLGRHETLCSATYAVKAAG